MSMCWCPACGEQFSGVSAFDQHQTTDYASDHPVTCHDPATRGLVRGSRGWWGRDIRPGELHRRQALGVAGVLGAAWP